VGSPFDAQAFPCFEDSSAKPECLQGATFPMPHQFENADRRTQAGCTEVKREIPSILIPCRDCSGSNKNPGVVRERQPKG
jgi:hypothetical protein